MPGRPGLLGKGTYARTPYGLVDPPHTIYLPTNTSPEAELALALYREGLSVNSVPFAFLSFFKIFNIRFPTGPTQTSWVNNNLHKIWYSPATDRLQELQRTQPDVGQYLYVQGRCAVAHANASPLVNPDDYAERRRLEFDMPLLKELATLFIEQELGVLTDATFNKTFDSAVHAGQALMRGQSQAGWILYEPFH